MYHFNLSKQIFGIMVITKQIYRLFSHRNSDISVKIYEINLMIAFMKVMTMR